MKNININDYSCDYIKKISKDWMLVCSGNEDKSNAMTASWGGVGFMWNKPVVFVVVRPSRYTKSFIDKYNCLSLNFMSNEFREILSYFGSVSGRDCDKIKDKNLSLAYNNSIPYMKDADFVMTCKVLYKQAMNKQCLLGLDIHDKWYSADDYHELYICEILESYIKD